MNQTRLFSADGSLVGIRPGILYKYRAGLAAGAALVGIRPGILLVEAGLARYATLRS